MRTGITISVSLHVAVLAALWIGVPHFGQRMMPPPDSISVDVISEEELARRTAPEEPEPEAEPEPEPQPEPEEVEPEPDPPPAPEPPEVAETPPPAPESPPQPPELQARAEPAPEPEPEPEPVPESVPEPEPEPDPEPEPEEEVTPTPPSPPQRPAVQLAEEDEPVREEPREDRLTSILRNVEDLREEEPRRQQEARAEPEAEPEREPEPVQPRADEMAQQLSASQRDAIRRQIERCWNVPAGARDAQDLIVEIRVRLNQDGSVREAEIISKERMDDSFYRTAAESALRAVRICSPLQGLPSDRYEQWRDMRLRFDPQEMLG